MNREIILFKTNEGKEMTFEDLLKKIYENAEAKQISIENTVAHVAPLIQSLPDAVTMLPYLTELQNAGIRNDDMLIKMAAIVQRGLVKNAKNKFNHEDLGGITAEERNMLIEQAKQIRDASKPGSSTGD